MIYILHSEYLLDFKLQNTTLKYLKQIRIPKTCETNILVEHDLNNTNLVTKEKVKKKTFIVENSY